MKAFQNILLGLILTAAIAIFVTFIMYAAAPQHEYVLIRVLVISAAVAVVCGMLSPFSFRNDKWNNNL